MKTGRPRKIKKPSQDTEAIARLAEEIKNADPVEEKKKAYFLTATELQEVQRLVLEGKTDVEISKILGRDRRTIVTTRRKIGIKKDKSSKASTDITSNEQVKFSTSHQAKIVYWHKELVASPRYPSLVERLTDADLKIFVEMWCKFHIDVEDMNTAEEDMLEVLLTLKLRINENDRAFKMAKERETALQRKYRELGDDLNLETDSHRWLYEQIMSNNMTMQNINRDVKDIIEKYNVIARNLNLAREQREAKKGVGVDTFQKLVAKFTEADRRVEAGKYAERMRLATEKKDIELKTAHTFADGEKSPIILDGADIYEQRKELNKDD